ncbi:ring finger domain containing protein [Nitzschia inconspicua]|uniref:Ring finger domain containing protein n=1 Tax=Nitzschia inconspicua TaxID=303405 RepID=A0A9K3LE10_9STRA|nr:ring finger domain containing protein [Nitzschia inconspicua]
MEIECNDCGALVPENHMDLHQLHGCRSRLQWRQRGQQQQQHSSNNSNRLDSSKSLAHNTDDGTTTILSSAPSANRESPTFLDGESATQTSSDDDDDHYDNDDHDDDDDDSVQLLDSQEAIRKMRIPNQHQTERTTSTRRTGTLPDTAVSYDTDAIMMDCDDDDDIRRRDTLDARRQPQQRVISNSSEEVEEVKRDSKPPARSRRRVHRQNSRERGHHQQQQKEDDVIDLSGCNPSAVPAAATHAAPLINSTRDQHVATGAAPEAAISVDDNEDDTANQWACSKCTLLNPNNRATCEACVHPNPNYVRPPDSSHREQLVDDGPFFGNPFSSRGRSYRQGSTSPAVTGPSSPIGYAGLGGLMGAAVGAAGNYLQGRDPIRGALEGGTTGAVGGALFHQAMRVDGDRGAPNRTTVSHTYAALPSHDVAAARSSAAMGVAGYPSVTSSSRNSFNGSRPRSSFRMERFNEDGNDVTIIHGSDGSTRMMRRRNTSSHPRIAALRAEQQLQLLLQHHAAMTAAGAGGVRHGAVDIDNMNYEQILRAFGNGTENMGAEETLISQLPTHKLKDPNKELPEDARQCNICLEDFVTNDVRMCLPCFHGFHEDCCRKWLRQNGKCPVCQHRVTADEY